MVRVEVSEERGQAITSVCPDHKYVIYVTCDEESVVSVGSL